MDTEQAPYMADILLDLIHKDSYSTGEYKAFGYKLSLVWVIDASKDGERGS